MKKILLIIFLGCVFSVKAQEGKNAIPLEKNTNYSHYGIDYELVDVINPDSTMLSLIDLSQYDIYRHQSIDIEVSDFKNGVTILIYSFEHAQYNKTNPGSIDPWFGLRSSYITSIYHVNEADAKIIDDFRLDTNRNNDEIFDIVYDTANQILTFVYIETYNKTEIEELLNLAGISFQAAVVLDLNGINSDK